LLVLASTATAALPDTPVQEFLGLEQPRIAGEVDPPELIAVGRADLRPRPGARVFVLAAGDRPCGLLVDGPAQFTYRVTDPLSAPLARRHAGRANGLALSEAEGALMWTGTLRGAAIWGWQLEAAQAAARPAASASAPDWLTSLLADKISPNPGRDMLLSDQNGEPGYRWALLRGDGDDLMLDVDPRASVGLESLHRVRRLSRNVATFGGRWTLDELIAQPVARAWWEAPAIDFAAVDYEIGVRNDTADHVEVRTRARIEARRDGLRLLSLGLVGQSIRQNGDTRPFKITALRVDGIDASYVRTGNDLLVVLPRPLGAGGVATIEVIAEGDILERPEGDNYWRLSDESWYPRPRLGGLERATFTVSVEAPAPFVPFAPGQVLTQDVSGPVRKIVTRLALPMDGIHVIAGKYSTTTGEQDGRRVHVSTYASARPEVARRVAGIAGSVQGCLANWLGEPYPFPDLQILEITDWGWGQAPPGLIFVTREAFLSRASANMLDDWGAYAAQVVSRGVNERLAHEVAHGWFPHVAKVARREENWLSESLAEYASAECIARVDARDGKRRFKRQLSDWKMMAGEVGPGSSLYLAEHLGGEESDWRDRRDLLYGKGPLVFHAIRQQLAHDAGGTEEGDRLFLVWIRSYVRNFTYKTAETRHLIGILNQLTHRDWQPWFERYVYGAEPVPLD
jgi:hypothetical protein